MHIYIFIIFYLLCFSLKKIENISIENSDKFSVLLLSLNNFNIIQFIFVLPGTLFFIFFLPGTLFFIFVLPSTLFSYLFYLVHFFIFVLHGTLYLSFKKHDQCFFGAHLRDTLKPLGTYHGFRGFLAMSRVVWITRYVIFVPLLLRKFCLSDIWCSSLRNFCIIIYMELSWICTCWIDP